MNAQHPNPVSFLPLASGKAMNPNPAKSLVSQLPQDVPSSLRDALAARSLDERHILQRLPVAEWWQALADLVEARCATGRSWPQADKDRVRELARTALRFTRPDGSVAFSPGGADQNRARSIRSLAVVLDDVGLGTVARWWYGRRGTSDSDGPPPLPAFGDLARPLAMLRADWAKMGDSLAVDARDPALPRIELCIGGKPFIGPTWPGTHGPARMRLWHTSSTADCAEWSVGTGRAQIVRTAILLRNRGIAILAQQSAPTDEAACSRITLAPEIATQPIANSRALRLKPDSGGSTTCVIPLALDPEGGGSFHANGGSLLLTAPTAAGPRVWLPMLFSWDKDRIRKTARWRLLTVSEKGRICPSDRAFAARVSWGLGDGLVVYRSLARASTRTFLGHQTSARLLVGLFSAKGTVTPLLQVD